MERNEVERHAPQGRARTMSDAREAWYRSAEGTACAPLYVPDLLAELDAERAAHEATKAERDYYRDTLLSRHGGECIALLDELTALKARLALAEEMEAALEKMCAQFYAGDDSICHAGICPRDRCHRCSAIDAGNTVLAAWRAAK